FYQQRLHCVRADQRGPELAQDRGLIVPSQLALRGLEHLGCGRALGASAIDERVMRLDEGEMHLRDEDMRVVPRVADDRGALGVPEHVLAAGARQELCRIVPLKEERMTHG